MGDLIRFPVERCRPPEPAPAASAVGYRLRPDAKWLRPALVTWPDVPTVACPDGMKVTITSWLGKPVP